MRKLLFILFLLCLPCTTAAPLFADPSVLFHDDFRTQNPGWLKASGVKFGNGVCSFKCVKNSSTDTEYQGDVYNDCDVSARLRCLSPGADGGGCAGIVFWAKDTNEFYVARISPDGQYKISRWKGNRYLAPVDWTATKAIKKGRSVWNTVRVSMRGTSATLYINDQKIQSFTGSPQAAGSEVGMGAAGYPKSGTEWEFADFKVTSP